MHGAEFSHISAFFQSAAAAKCHGRVAFLSSPRIRLKSLIRKEPENAPQTLGEHIRRRRVELGLSQRAIAAHLGANVWTVLNWEKGCTKPPIGAMPGILAWLGYDPFPQPKTLSERMLGVRRVMGWTIAQAASRLGVASAAWGAWERSGRVPWERYQQLLERFLSPILRARPGSVDHMGD